MKRFVLSIALLSCLPVFAQDQSRGIPRTDLTIYRKGPIYQIEASLRLNGVEQQLTVKSTSLQWLDHTACLIRLTGDVAVVTKGIVLEADEADYHCGTGDIEPRGNVHLKVLPEQ